MNDDIHFLHDYCQKLRFRLVVNYHNDRVVVDGAWFPSATKAVTTIRQINAYLPDFMKPIQEEYEELLPEGDEPSVTVHEFKFKQRTDIAPSEGVVLVSWDDDAPQPVATIIAETESVTGALVNVPETLRALIKSRQFAASYGSGMVVISSGPIV